MCAGASPVPHTRTKVTIFEAAKNGDIPTIDRLLCHNKSIVKETDSTGSRPMHYAARNGRVEVMEHLYKIDPMLLLARSDSGMTVVHFAVCFWGSFFVFPLSHKNKISAFLD